jgi:hypothetical protein
MEEISMSIQVTLNIFSGRPNPSWLLSESQKDALMQKLEAIKKPTLLKPSGVLGRLGYRGFTLKSLHQSPQGAYTLLVHDGIVDAGQEEVNRVADNRDLEEWLLDTEPGQIDKAVKDIVSSEIKKGIIDAAGYFLAGKDTCPTCQAADAPPYQPESWNVPNVQPYNNCYNYANNSITNTYAQPGRAHGAMYEHVTCPDVNTAAIADGLVNSANFSDPLSPGQGWYVALVIAPQWPDFHWYRQDNSGCWSHKPGGTAVRNVDNSGNIITDPRTCDRGNYTEFCTFMVTNRSVVIR